MKDKTKEKWRKFWQWLSPILQAAAKAWAEKKGGKR